MNLKHIMLGSLEKLKKLLGSCQKDTEARALLAKPESFCATKQIMMVMDFNTLNKIVAYADIIKKIPPSRLGSVVELRPMN